MVNKELQERRMRDYFIQATREILKGEGLRSVSVRHIAEKAGYSYATMYNYFKDAKELIFECVQDFQDECETLIQGETQGLPRGPEKIRAITKAYIKYFIQYPGIFELFFLERMSELGHKQPLNESIVIFLDRLCEEEWNYCIGQNLLKPDEAELKKTVLRDVVVGLLLFYLNRNYPQSYADFQVLTDQKLDFILNRSR